ncbi:fumarylacetoacetate hydrolase family protein [Actinocorallia sp. A-T 12471]|uniref:fumarylacetoacetate hydrolase family protein n=1 Tax=Actinocorallia sp. A-T 12471 TaxID=3089813 RepID=UPI0029CEE922|nr:fumarylacetoacetate hydrolase family protein [Actinocorallia sp. A-T 12471]MDX6741547.1 fumarylacetoacetate hydrolase family protein [Actinocorallia sp. A-T 12471]
MKFASYVRDGTAAVGVVTDAGLVALTDLRADAPSDMRSVLAWLDRDRPDLRPEGSGTAIPLAEVEFLPVVPDPHAIWCAALTYLSHVREGGDRPVPDHPLFFLRVAASQVGHGRPLLVPGVSAELDYEGELAVVIGRAGRHIPVSDALRHVAGYACYNDGSVRDWQRHTTQITMGKNFGSTGGFGPWLVTPEEFGDPYRHRLTTRLNGEVMQSASIGELLFSIEYLIHYVSTASRLEVGDVIVTGTCGGVGLRRRPPVFMRPGDVVEVEIDGLGTLRNPVALETGGDGFTYRPPLAVAAGGQGGRS